MWQAETDDPDDTDGSYADDLIWILAESSEVDWSEIGHAYGVAEDVPVLLRNWLDADRYEPSDDPEQMMWEVARDDFINSVFHQGSLYSASIPAIGVLIRVLDRGLEEDRLVAAHVLAMCLNRSERHWAADRFDTAMNRDPEHYDAAAAGFETYLRVLGDPASSPALRSIVAELLVWIPAHARTVGVSFLWELTKAVEVSPDRMDASEFEAQLLLHLGVLSVGGETDRFESILRERLDAPDPEGICAAISLARMRLVDPSSEVSLIARINEVLQRDTPVVFGTNHRPDLRFEAAASLLVAHLHGGPEPDVPAAMAVLELASLTFGEHDTYYLSELAHHYQLALLDSVAPIAPPLDDKGRFHRNSALFDTFQLKSGIIDDALVAVALNNGREIQLLSLATLGVVGTLVLPSVDGERDVHWLILENTLEPTVGDDLVDPADIDVTKLSILQLHVSNDGCWVAVAATGAVVVWNIDHGWHGQRKIPAAVIRGFGTYPRIAWSPDTKHLAIVDRRQLQLVAVESWEPMTPTEIGHWADIAWAPGYDLLCNYNGQANMWRAETESFLWDRPTRGVILASSVTGEIALERDDSVKRIRGATRTVAFELDDLTRSDAAAYGFRNDKLAAVTRGPDRRRELIINDGDSRTNTRAHWKANEHWGIRVEWTPSDTMVLVTGGTLDFRHPVTAELLARCLLPLDLEYGPVWTAPPHPQRAGPGFSYNANNATHLLQRWRDYEPAETIDDETQRSEYFDAIENPEVIATRLRIGGWEEH